MSTQSNTSLTDLTQTAYALVFLCAWSTGCVSVALLLRIATAMGSSNWKHDGSGDRPNHANEAGGFGEKQLAKGKALLMEIPEGLGIYHSGKSNG